MPMFEHASHLIINESTFLDTTILVNKDADLLQYLLEHVASGASHDSKNQHEKPKCHPDTRKKLLSDVNEWIKVPDKETGILYLHGPTGAGKSCIARSVCEQAAKEGLLGASFFFWRGSSSRNNGSQLITTLAYQLGEANAELKQHILLEVAENPRIVDMPLEVQFRKLVFEPCSKVPRERLSVRAIVIDGLDECMGECTQISILQMLAHAVRHEGFPLGFFITSRPELHLQEALDTKEIIFATNVISLNRIPGVLQDIRTVLQSGFNRILNNSRFKKSFKSVSRPWPTAENIDKLVQDSSGQFIYAGTVLNFISDPDNNPASQLQIMLHIQNSQEGPDISIESPLANLDRLYRRIMSGVRHPERTLKVLSYVIAMKDLARTSKLEGWTRFSPPITGAVMYNQNRLLTIIEQLLGLSDGMAYLALNQLHSLISLKVGSESTRRHMEIDFYHKSFQDFLLTEQRSTIFHVKLDCAHSEIAHSCLKFMELSKYKTESQHVGWIYSCFQWYLHQRLSHRKLDMSNFKAALTRFFVQTSNDLNSPKLKAALKTLGLLDNSFFGSLQKYGLLSMEDLFLSVNDVRDSLYGFNVTPEVKSFDSMYAYPVWRKLLKSYNNDTRIKHLLLVCHYTRVDSDRFSERIFETDICNLLRVLGLISDEFERISVLSQYADIRRQFCYFMDRSLELELFFMTAEFSETFFCAQEVISSVYAAIISTGIWRNYPCAISFGWKNNAKVTATCPLLECLKSEALEFLNDIELNRKLNRRTEEYFVCWLHKKLKGQTEEAIKAWTRTFDKARSLFPDNFKDKQSLEAHK